MSYIGYIYPQWLSAKSDLMRALDLSQKQQTILADWFRSHVFEHGVDYRVSRDLFKLLKKEDLENEIQWKCCRALAESIFQSRLFMRELTHGPFDSNYRYTMLLFGVPQAGVGSAKRLGPG